MNVDADARSTLTADLQDELAKTRALLADLPGSAWAWAPRCGPTAADRRL